MSDNVPVKGRKRVEAQTLVHAGNRGQGEVLGCDPRDPVEDAESGEDVIWEPKIHKHGYEGRCKEAVLRDTEDLIQRACNWIIHL